MRSPPTTATRQESFAKRRMRHRRPIPIIGTAHYLRRPLGRDPRVPSERTFLFPILGALVTLAACEGLTPTTAESLVGTWEARRYDGDVVYIARLTDDGRYSLTAPGETEPYQTGAWSYDREQRTLTIGGTSIPVSSEGADQLCVVPHPRGGDCMITWRRMQA